MATKAEVRDRVGQMLQRVGLGKSMDDALKNRIDTAYTEVYQDLKDDQLVTWAIAGTIPDKVAPHLAALMAFNCTSSIHVSDRLFSRIVANRNIAKREIRRLVTPQYESLDEAEDF